jgi:hypothetical protein
MYSWLLVIWVFLLLHWCECRMASLYSMVFASEWRKSNQFIRWKWLLSLSYWGAYYHNKSIIPPHNTTTDIYTQTKPKAKDNKQHLPHTNHQIRAQELLITHHLTQVLVRFHSIHYQIQYLQRHITENLNYNSSNTNTQCIEQ